jgi:hypothetical protein
MEKILTIIFLLSILSVCYSQTNFQDTLIIESKTFKIIKSDWGARFNLGISKFNYGDKTAEWLGNHASPDLNLSILYKNYRFGIGFKPWTVNPKSELEFNGDTLTTFANLNPIKFEFLFGYNFSDLEYVNIEPYIGYLINSFEVINEDVLQKKYDIPTQSGFTIGISVYKELIDFNPYDNLQLFINTNYNFVDFSKVNSALDNNFWAFEIGITYQSWFTRTEIIE